MATTAGPRALLVVRFHTAAAGTSQTVVRQHCGFWVEIANTGDPDLAVSASRFFREFAHDAYSINCEAAFSAAAGDVKVLFRMNCQSTLSVCLYSSANSVSSMLANDIDVGSLTITPLGITCSV